MDDVLSSIDFEEICFTALAVLGLVLVIVAVEVVVVAIVEVV